MADRGDLHQHHAGHEHGSPFNHFLPVYTAEQMRRTDANAIKGMGMPGVVLMERAGIGVAEHLLDSYCDQHCFVVLAGKGNNGGDGFVVARHLHEAGAEVQVFAAGRTADYTGDALVNLKLLSKIGIKVKHMPGRAQLVAALAGDCVIVDAVFGTGFAGEPRGKAAEFISAAAQAAERYGQPVVAVDVASGIDASTGQVAANTLPADSTVTFHAPKLGHLVEPGRYFSGDVILADIGIPADAGVDADHFLVDREVIAATLPYKHESDNKFTTGRVLVAGGSTGLTGAPCMAAESAIRAGAGVVTVAAPESLIAIFEQKLLEVMKLPLADEGEGWLSRGSIDILLERAQKFDCVALGPGLGKEPETAALVRDFLARHNGPVVLDADGLGALNGRLGLLKKRAAPTVLTPHAGELARLLGKESDEVAANRLQYARDAARRSGAVILLKGSCTLVTDGRVTLINDSGNPGLATAGSGDVLTGLLAALAAKGMEPMLAAAAGAYLHGLAADIAAEEAGQDNLVASDLIDFLPDAFMRIRESEEEE